MKKAILNKYALNGYTVHSNLPIGAPMPWLSDNLPVGFLAFDGSEYNISDYPELYNVVKNIPSFHSDTEGKFKIPNLKGRVLQGADTVIGELIEAGLPNIIGEVKNNDANYGSIQMVNPKFEGAFSGKSHGNAGWSGSVWGCHTLKIDASKGETKTDGTIKGTDEPHVYGNSDTVQPPAFTVRWIIKATQYSTVEQNAIDDTRFTTGNVLSAAKVVEMNSYSTDEIKTEYRWVDNKPVYRKVFIDPNNSWSSGDNLIGNIENFKEPISIKAIALNSSLMGWVENNEGGNSRCYAYVKPNGDVHFYRYDISDGSAYPKKVIIEYTKTTD